MKGENFTPVHQKAMSNRPRRSKAGKLARVVQGRKLSPPDFWRHVREVLP